MVRRVSFTSDDMIRKFVEYQLDNDLYEAFYKLTVCGLISTNAWEAFEKNTIGLYVDEETGEVVDESGYVVDESSIEDYF